ncbi:MAG: FAD-dependent oxidoreductase [Nitrospirae bacterium]|nr:FAD-dependent oxidoreductase [Nitrospirota bacterium]
MTSQGEAAHLVIVVGAGPAGMAVVNNLSKEGHRVAVLNRDIKFGGLAEYGIFPTKHRLRGGLLKGYQEILDRENVDYFGNVTVGERHDIRIQDLREIGADALVIATGAQGTKTIGVEGDQALGVYHAKEIVYHYNQLPGFSQRPFEMGRRVAIIGMGNVMADIAHWLIRYRKVEEVVAVARRGPAERKYSPKEIRAVCANLDRDDLVREWARIRPRLEAAGQNADQLLSEMSAEMTPCEPASSETRLCFRFLSSPRRILTDSNRRIRGVELEETKLEPEGEDLVAVRLKSYYEIPCDSVVFAVGDRVDETLGLPSKDGIFLTHPKPTGNDPDDSLFRAYDDRTGEAIEGVFLAGWARKASEGLVGIAKRDGDLCSKVVQWHLATRTPLDKKEMEEKLRRLRILIEKRQPDAVPKEELQWLREMEEEEGRRRGIIEGFKFPANRQMLAAIRHKKMT